MALPYLRYVSDAKVDQYFERISPGLLKGITAELKIDLKLVQLTVKPEARESSRYARLEVVKKYLEKHEKIGTIQDPKPWFRGTAALAQARVGNDDRAVIVFAGRSDGTLLGTDGIPSPRDRGCESINWPRVTGVRCDRRLHVNSRSGPHSTLRGSRSRP